MKRLLILAIFFFSVFCVSAQEFSFESFVSMGDYIGKQIRDIPDGYVREGIGSNSYSRNLTREVYDGFTTSDGIIIGYMWGINSNRRSFIYSEFDKIVPVIKEQFGEPLPFQDVMLFWILGDKLLLAAAEDDTLIVFFGLPGGIGITQDRLDELVESMSNN